MKLKSGKKWEMFMKYKQAELQMQMKKTGFHLTFASSKLLLLMKTWRIFKNI